VFRYIASAGIALLLLAIALKSRGGATAATTEGGAATLTIRHERPHVETARNGDGTLALTVRHRLAASVSRVSLVYEIDGREETLDRTDCHRSLRRAATSVELGGNLPADARTVHLVLEDETGTTIVPVALE
jgi:hypothetical protein